MRIREIAGEGKREREREKDREIGRWELGGE